MKYTTPRAFRHALENRLRTEYPRHQIPRLRKMIAFERFMARMNKDWILKGGYALQLRTEKARTTQDIDLLATQTFAGQLFEKLVQQAQQEIGDYFDFSIERKHPELELGGAVRFGVTARLAGRVFERFHVDVGLGDTIVDPVEYLSPPRLLAFAEMEATSIPCYPVSQHIAEKFHALVRPRPVETSRIKDLVDILLFANMDILIQADRLNAAIEAVFIARGDKLPTGLDQVPRSWKTKFNQMSKSLGLPYEDFDQAVTAAQLFLDPLLSGETTGVWNTEAWQWEKG